MPRTLYATVKVPLPPDQFEAAAAMVRIKPHWDTFLAGLAQDNADVLPHLEILVTKAPIPGIKRARRPRQPSAESSTAAIGAFEDAVA